MLVNTNPTYRNPDPFATGIARHYPGMGKIVGDTIRIFTGIPLREREGEPNDQPEAIAVIVVDYDGLNPAALVTGSPAPQPGDDAHYASFVRRLCRLYGERF